MSWGYAMCGRCRLPLIPTMVFRKAEFYCLGCGVKSGFLDPVGEPETPEMLAQYEALKAEWDEHVAGKILGNFWLATCTKCDRHAEYHKDHATPEELAADAEARAWLEQRKTVHA